MRACVSGGGRVGLCGGGMCGDDVPRWCWGGPGPAVARRRWQCPPAAGRSATARRPPQRAAPGSGPSLHRSREGVGLRVKRGPGLRAVFCASSPRLESTVRAGSLAQPAGRRRLSRWEAARGGRSRASPPFPSHFDPTHTTCRRLAPASVEGSCGTPLQDVCHGLTGWGQMEREVTT
jgi:hypothetical protein